MEISICGLLPIFNFLIASTRVRRERKNQCAEFWEKKPSWNEKFTSFQKANSILVVIWNRKVQLQMRSLDGLQ
jgi:hypothetical protein